MQELKKGAKGAAKKAKSGSGKKTSLLSKGSEARLVSIDLQNHEMDAQADDSQETPKILETLAKAAAETLAKKAAASSDTQAELRKDPMLGKAVTFSEQWSKGLSETQKQIRWTMLEKVDLDAPAVFKKLAEPMI